VPIPTSEPEVIPPKPIVSPEAMNIFLRADLNRYKEAAEKRPPRVASVLKNFRNYWPR
jgi:hypothetical protein